jgi:hypothetical protein
LVTVVAGRDWPIAAPLLGGGVTVGGGDDGGGAAVPVRTGGLRWLLVSLGANTGRAGRGTAAFGGTGLEAGNPPRTGCSTGLVPAGGNAGRTVAIGGGGVVPRNLTRSA